ncbi:unnamed protein product [Ectocarpus sp. 8 AP-2014]
MKLPFEDNSFDGVYAIEATCHAPQRYARRLLHTTDSLDTAICYTRRARRSFCHGFESFLRMMDWTRAGHIRWWLRCTSCTCLASRQPSPDLCECVQEDGEEPTSERA